MPSVKRVQFRAGQLIVLGCLLFSGCRVPLNTSDVSREIFSVEVLRPDLVRKGGSLEVRPFRPGQDAAATNTFDRFVLMLIRGAADQLEEPGHALTFFLRQGPERPDLVIDGQVERFQMPGRLGKMLLKNRVDMLLRAELRTQNEQDLIALIMVQKRFSLDDKEFESEAYAIGQGIVLRLLEQRREQ